MVAFARDRRDCERVLRYNDDTSRVPVAYRATRGQGVSRCLAFSDF